RAASYAEEAARAQVNTVYLDVLDQVCLIREQIENKQKQMGVLSQRRATTIRTKELYQEQYKLGTRTVVDLLNAEQAIHSAAQEIESARYDIYSAIVQ
ncbi:TolC family protein, partial [Klebsiella pneumoniae]|nr:TolC family protein [Klebsiella pneumoniae]